MEADGDGIHNQKAPLLRTFSHTWLGCAFLEPEDTVGAAIHLENAISGNAICPKALLAQVEPVVMHYAILNPSNIHVLPPQVTMQRVVEWYAYNFARKPSP